MLRRNVIKLNRCGNFDYYDFAKGFWFNQPSNNDITVTARPSCLCRRRFEGVDMYLCICITGKAEKEKNTYKFIRENKSRTNWSIILTICWSFFSMCSEMGNIILERKDIFHYFIISRSITYVTFDASSLILLNIYLFFSWNSINMWC